LLLLAVFFGSGLPAADLDARDPDMAKDLENFREIRGAIEAYRKDHGGRLPDWLSDLFPRYLTDPEVLLCPAAERSGQAQLFGNDDPRMRSSYIYEFNTLPASDFHVTDPTARATMKDWKTKQMEAFGAAVPMVRCLNHPRVLNLAVSGDIYETALFWETDPNTLALMGRLGVKPAEAPEGREWVVEVADAETGAAVAGARVRVLARGPTGYLPAHDGVTDREGRCRTVLTGGTVRELRLQVTHDDYVAGSITWQEEEGLEVPPEHRVTLEKGITVGGRVEDPTGGGIAGVEVTLYAGYRARPAATGASLLPATPVPAVTTDEGGEWRVRGVSPLLYRAMASFEHPRYRRLQVVTQPLEVPVDGGFTVAELTNRTVLIVLQPQAIVRVEAVDIDTMRPIETFTVLQAFSGRSGLAWDAGRIVSGHGGQAELRLQEEYERLPALVRAQAPGYRPVISSRLREIPFEQTIQLALPKVGYLEGRVVDAEGRGVSGAAVGLLTGLDSLAIVADGLEAGPGGAVVRSGENGRFRLPDGPDAIGLVAWHETGLAEVDLADFRLDSVLRLAAWGRVTGTVPPGLHGDPGVTLIGMSEHLPRLFPTRVPGLVHLEAETCLAEADEAGRFVLERVPPGRRILWHPVLVGPDLPPMEYAYSFNGRWVEVQPGQSVPVVVAQRSVRARLLPPDDPQSTAADQNVQTLMMARYGLIGQPAGRMISWPQALGWVRFESLDEPGAAPFEALVTFSYDGQFRLEGVPVGRQKVRLRIFQPPQLLGTAELEITIRESDTLVRLGDEGGIRLTQPRTLVRGEAWPDWARGSAEGILADAWWGQGRPVWLHFWTSWSGAGEGSFRSLSRLLDELGGAMSPRVVSVNLDLEVALARRAVPPGTGTGLPVRGDGWLTSVLAEVCGVESLPWMAWLDGEGRLQGSGPAEPDLPEGLRGAALGR